ncbi:MAG: hypothetical protein DRR19_04730, partial [Candidatus Parabeggiatoa sp. nov. 1]
MFSRGANFYAENINMSIVINTFVNYQSKSHDLASRYAAMQAREQQRWQHLLDDGIENWADRFERIADQRG